MFCMCTLRHNMLTLQESVPISTGNKLQQRVWVLFCVHVDETCEWNSRQLTECITHTPLSWLTARVHHLTPIFLQYCPGGILPLEWGNSWGSRMPTSSSLITFPKCLGELEGQMLRLGLKHSLDGLLHQTRAIGEVCCFLHKVLFPHPIPSYTALESSYSWCCLPTCPLTKKQQHFVEKFCWTRFEKITFLLVQEAQRLGDFASNAVLVMKG